LIRRFLKTFENLKIKLKQYYYKKLDIMTYLDISFQNERFENACMQGGICRGGKGGIFPVTAS